MASLVLGVAGGVAGFVLSGGNPIAAQIGFSLGAAAGGILFPPKGPDGPRLHDLSVQSSAYGQAIPIPYGTDRIAGNIIWAQKIQEHANEQGGKGGPTYTTYSYTCTFASAICAGPIAGILRIWADGLLIYDRRPTSTGQERGFKASSFKLYLGTEDQLPDPTIQALQGDTPAYRGLAYIVFTDLQLEKFGNRIPSLTFEYVTSGTGTTLPSTTFGESYVSGAATTTFDADMDANGHIWLHTMSGRAWVNPVTGVLEIGEGAPLTPQIQEYDAATGELLWYYNVPPVTEHDVDGDTDSTIYPIRGKGICSGGYYFIGRGLSGTTPNDGTFIHGMAVNTQTHDVTQFYDECSSSQFQNAFYWPSVPVPVIDNNKVYFASGNGLESGFGVGFMPAHYGVGPDVVDPLPDRSGEIPLWNIPAGWRQARAKTDCPVQLEGGPPPTFDGTGLILPGYAYKSTLIRNPDGVIVQGSGTQGGSYVALVRHAPIVDGFDLSAPSSVLFCELPGSSVTMPPVAWDPNNNTIWAFAGGGGSNSILYAITPGGSGVSSGGGLTPTATGFVMPAVPGESQGDDVKGMLFDEDTGYLRLLMGGGFDDEVHIVLFDPVAQTIVEDRVIESHIASTTGKMWNMPEQNKVIYTEGYRLYSIPYGAPLTHNAVNLGAIVRDVSLRCGLTDADIDVSELTDLVDGYTLTRQMAGRSAIEPLMQAYSFDPVESDYRIKFRKRGRRSVVTIPDDDLAAHSSGSEAPDLVQIKRKQEVDLPQSVSVKYKDRDADYQTGAQYERRMTGRSQSDVTVDLPIAMSADKAKQVAAAALYSAWAERTGVSFATSQAYAALEPTDMAIVHGRLVRIVHRKRNGGILEWEAYADGNTIYPSDSATQGGTAAPSGPVGQVITATPLTQLIAIDAPITQEGTTGPVLTFAVQGQGLGWTGAQIFKSIDGGVSYQPITSAPTASLIGTATNVLGAYQGGDTFDELNTVRVKLLPSSTGATLASATELAVLNGANAALLGNEVLQYKRAVLNDDGSHTLSGLLRYRRGTDYAVHAIGERFVPLTSALVQIPVSTSEIGLPRQYKAVSSGGTLSSAQAVTLTYTGNDLKPYSPVHIGGWRDTAGDLTLTWVRRTRIGGEWRDGVDVALGEAAEAYDVEILNGSVVVRTFSGVTSPTVVYTASDQVAGFGSLQSSVTARVYQLSSVIGRGWPGTGTV
jgi:hypothetical protein